MTLSDRQLEQMLRLAREADEAAEAWHRQPAQHGRSGLRLAARADIPGGPECFPVVTFWKRARVFAAAAGIVFGAGLVYWTLVSPAGSSVKSTAPFAATTGPNRDVTAVAGAGHDSAHPDADPFEGPLADDPSGAPVGANSVVLAIVPDDRGELRCVRWLPGPLCGAGGPGLAGVHADELRAMGMGMLCEETAPRVLVVGLEGPAGSLPASDAHAADLARCILKSPGGKLPGASEVCTPGTCMPSTVRMRMEAVTVR
jgi:hypothetical protein